MYDWPHVAAAQKSREHRAQIREAACAYIRLYRSHAARREGRGDRGQTRCGSMPHATDATSTSGVREIRPTAARLGSYCITHYTPPIRERSRGVSQEVVKKCTNQMYKLKSPILEWTIKYIIAAVSSCPFWGCSEPRGHTSTGAAGQGSLRVCL